MNERGPDVKHRPEKRARLSPLLKIVLVAVVGAIIYVGYQAYDALYGPNVFAGVEKKAFFVSKGQTFGTVADSLRAAGIIRSRELFVFAGKLFGGSGRIKVGKYEFTSGISNVELFLSLREGRNNVMIPVTLREGVWARRQASTFARLVGIDSARYMQLVTSERFARSLGIAKVSLEGYLLPETYHLQWQESEETIIRKQVGEFWKVFDDSLRTRAAEMGWSMHDVVTLASIIEGETGLDEERGKISGVYHNRLRKGMLLQADPTIQYFIENGPRRVTYSDLKIDNPYNTYRKKGLPPGPVNNPGSASIRAALFPETHNYLYFVATGKGGHWFSRSYDEHLQQVRKYRKVRAEQQSARARTSDRRGS